VIWLITSDGPVEISASADLFSADLCCNIRVDVTADASCVPNFGAPVHVFGARVHTHDIGTVVSGYKYFSAVRVFFLYETSGFDNKSCTVEEQME
jgi:hypothetical protein